MQKNKSAKHVYVGGVGRSGTTWCTEIINAQECYKESFEPYIHYLDLGLGYTPFLPKDEQLGSDITGRLSEMVTVSSPAALTLVKDIRCNLMLSWLQHNTPLTHLVYIIRNPLQVACSWQKLGWGKALKQEATDVEVLMQQNTLIEAYPVISDAHKIIESDNRLESAIFVWSVHHLITSMQIDSNNVHLLYYEDLVLTPENEIKKLYAYLGQEFIWSDIEPSVNRFSRSTMPARKKAGKSQSMIDGWKTTLTRQEIKRCQLILDTFGLSDVYLPNGMPSGLGFFLN